MFKNSNKIKEYKNIRIQRSLKVRGSQISIFPYWYTCKTIFIFSKKKCSRLQINED